MDCDECGGSDLCETCRFTSNFDCPVGNPDDIKWCCDLGINIVECSRYEQDFIGV